MVYQSMYPHTGREAREGEANFPLQTGLRYENLARKAGKAGKAGKARKA
jgi:hypothetical protein